MSAPAARRKVVPLSLALCGALLLLCGSAAPAAAKPASQGDTERVEYLNKKAMEDYDSLEFEQARRTLVDCVARLRTSGTDQTPLAAQTYIHLGIVYVGGLHDKNRGQKQFEQALSIDPTLRLDPTVATPEMQQAWSAAVAALPRKKRQAVEEASKSLNSSASPPVPDSAVAQVPSVPAPTGNAAADALLHTPIEDAAPGQRITIVTRPTVPVAKVTLFYRTPGQEQYTQVPLQRGRKNRGDFFGHIPEEAVGDRSLQYYLEAADGAGTVVGRQGSAESPFIVSVTGGKPAAPVNSEDQEDPLAPVRREQAGQKPRPAARDHVYFDVALGTGGAIIGSGATTEVAYFYSNNGGVPQYQPTRASGGGFVWGGLGVRAEIGAYFHKGLSLGISNRFEVLLNNNADSSANTANNCGNSPCYATTSRVFFGYTGLLKLRYQFLRRMPTRPNVPFPFRPYVHFDVGGGTWRGGLNIDGSKSSNPLLYPTDACSAAYNGLSGGAAVPAGCSSVGNIKGYNLSNVSGTPYKPLNQVCPGSGPCVDSVLLGYGMVGGGAGIYLGGDHFGFTVDLTLLGAFGGANSGALIDVYMGPQFIF